MDAWVGVVIDFSMVVVICMIIMLNVLVFMVMLDEDRKSDNERSRELKQHKDNTGKDPNKIIEEFTRERNIPSYSNSDIQDYGVDTHLISEDDLNNDDRIIYTYTRPKTSHRRG